MKNPDISGYICKYFYYFTQILIQKIFTILVWPKAKLFGIKLGKRCKFYGNVKFYRSPGSKIIIGNDCSFRSIDDSNLIGINHKCILSAQTKEASIIIGKNSHFSGTIIGAFTDIIIGNNVKCGANTIITDGDWHKEDPRNGISKPVKIKDNVWLGLNVVIWKGVTIGENSLIGANSLVVKDIPANVIAAGTPCRVIRILDYKEH